MKSPKTNQEQLGAAGAWLGAGSGVAIPALTFFRDYTPPLFPQVALVLTALSGAMIYALGKALNQEKATSPELKRVMGRAMLSIAVAVVFMAVYAVLMNYWTVTDPQSGAVRYQIGFGTAAWSLTGYGRMLISKYPASTPQYLMLIDGAFVPGGPQRIWTPWSTAVAGIALILCYLLAFGCWTAGFSLLLKHRRSSARRN